MMTTRSSATILLTALVLAACGADPGTGPGTETEGELEVIVPPDADGEYPPDLIVACRTGPSFPISALGEMAPLDEADPGGVADAIAPFLSGEEGDFWPQEDWQVLHSTDDEIQLVARSNESGLAFMSVIDEGSGWSWTGASMSEQDCPMEFVVPDGLNTVSWHLDPDAPAIEPSSTSLEVVLNERECVGGQEIGDRLLGPQIVMTESQVFIAFAAEPPPGDAFDCPGNPDMPFTVELPEPIGDRELVEGLETGLILDDYVD